MPPLPTSAIREDAAIWKRSLGHADTKCSSATVHTGVIKSFVRAVHSAAGGRQRVRRAAHPRRAAHITRTWECRRTESGQASLP
jgi:hypothetical protein